MLRKAKALHDLELRARDGILGKVKDFYFDDRHWTIRYLVVETGTWLDSRRVLLATSVIGPVDWIAGLLEVNLTQDQIRNSPGIDTESPVTRDQEQGLHAYYGWPAYWLGTGYGGMGMGAGVVDAGATFGTGSGVAISGGAPVPPLGGMFPVTRMAPNGDPSLRRGRGVAGYHLEAVDGSIGHLEDYLLDDANWTIRYLIIDTKNWLPGRKVVVYPELVTEVNWAQSRLFIDLTKDQLRESPAYDADTANEEEYAERLRAYHANLPQLD